jgi:acetyltransferase-like isoleucine patch superfamily enzyme
VIGEGATICTGAIVFASAAVGAGSVVGDQAYVRERAVVGARSVIGRGTAVDNDVVVGDRVSVQTGVYLTAFSVVEDDVFVGPCAMTTNDDTMNRHDDAYVLRGATLRRACRIGGGAVLTPGVEVGEEAFVAAGALVTRDVPRARGDGRARARRARGRRRGPAGTVALSVPTRRLRARRSGLRIDRKTWALGATAFASTAALAAGEYARVWRRGSAPLPTETTDVLDAAGEAVAETVEVAVTGYRSGSTRENALFNLLASFSMTFGTPG